MERPKMFRMLLHFCRRLVKGVLLAAWIAVLAILAVEAATGRASFLVSHLWELGSFSFIGLAPSGAASPREQLQSYLVDYKNAPPIATVLDQVLTNPSWSDRDVASRYRGPAEPENQPRLAGESMKQRWVREQYSELFAKIDRKLNAIASEKTSDPKLAMITIEIPEAFRTPKEPHAREVSLPTDAQLWISQTRIRLAAEQDRDALINTFFLLIVLGAFGSLIFLTKDYIEIKEGIGLAAYLFRPILGMFLAVSMFVIDVVANSLVSTASILQIRHETLYLLAFGGGLLSEQAYKAVSLRAEAALEKLRSKPDREEDSQSPSS